VCAFGILFLRRDDEAARLQKEGEFWLPHIPGSRQIIIMHHRVATERQCRDDWVVCGAILVRLDMDKYMGNHDALAWKVLIQYNMVRPLVWRCIKSSRRGNARY